MDKINGAGHVGRQFVTEDAGLNRPPSEITADWLNGVQGELVAVIEGAGLALSSIDNTQLRQAIAKMIQAGQRAVIVNNCTFAGAVIGVGKVVYWDSANNRFDLALADGSAKQSVVGFADVPNGNVYCFGNAVLFAGLTPGARYYLDAVTAGAMTTAAPANAVYLGIARNATEVFADIDWLGVQANQANTYTKAQRGAVSALVDGATVTPDFSLANNFSLTLGGNRTLASPSNLVAGQSGIITIKQDATGSRTLAFNSAWKFAGGTVPSLTTTANATDQLAYYVNADGTTVFASLNKDVK